MRISTKTRYAVRVMLRLALDYGGGPSMLGDIARKEELSEKYLSIIMIPLRSDGLVNSVRGSKGGYLLARKPSEISIRDIYEATDGQVCTTDSGRTQKKSSNTAEFVSKEVWERLDREIARTLGSITLDDILESYREQLGQPPSYEI